MSNKKITDLPTSSINDNTFVLFGDSSSGQLFHSTHGLLKNYFTSSGIVGSGSYLEDSASFDTRIKNVTGSITNTGSFVQTSSYNPFTSSYFTDSASFNTRINNVSGSTSIVSGSTLLLVLSGSLNTSGSALMAGIKADGTDQTSKLNTLLASGISQLDFDHPSGSSITISGAVTASNVNLKFNQGVKLTGSGSISGGYIVAGMHQQISDLGVSFTGLQGTQNGKISGLWFGAVAGQGDSQPYIQRAIDVAISNSSAVRTVFLPDGTYNISNPLMMYNYSSNNYQAFTTYFEGETSYWDNSNGTRLNLQNTESFAIGVQRGKGCKISRLKISGQFTPPFASGFNFYSCSFNNFKDGVTRDSVNSPHAGILIDPFCASGSVGDGGYPSLQMWYRGSGTGGSTGIEIEDVFVTNTVVGIATSVNGQYANAENILIKKYQGANLKLQIAGCQSQEKNNVVDGFYNWGSSHTIFQAGPGLNGYGPNNGAGNWILKNGNLAGHVNRLCAIVNSGYFPIYFYNVYMESTGQVGPVSGQVIFTDCNFDFALPVNESFSIIDWQINGGTFRGCQIRMYGTFLPVSAQNATFYDCIFETIPFVNGSGFINSAGMGASSPQNFPTTNPISANNNQGFYYGAATTNRYFIDNENYNEWQIPFFENSNTYALNVNGSDRHFDFTASAPTVYQVNNWVYALTGSGNTTVTPVGIVTNISSSVVTVTYTCPSIVSGQQYGLIAPTNVYLLPTFIGDTTTNSNIVNNVVCSTTDMQVSLGSLSGSLVKAQGTTLFGNYNQYSKVIAVSGSTITLNSNCQQTRKGVIFRNGFKKRFVYTTVDSSAPASTDIFDVDDEIWNFSGGQRKLYRVTQGGFFSSSTDARNLIMTPFTQPELTGTSTFNGDGSTTSFVVSHSLGAAPTYAEWSPTSVAAATSSYYLNQYTSGSVTVNYIAAPASGSGNVTGNWRVKV